MILPKFKEGDLVSASDWNLIASEVNRIWGSEAGPGLRLTKGEPWRISSTAAIGSASLEFNGPVWQIYVYRPTGADDYDVNAAPSAIFLTGPFTQTGTVNTKRIARLKWSGSRTVADAQFAANGGINLATGGQYLQQRMAKVPATGAMLFLGQTSDSTWLDGNNGVFWAANPTTGQRLFSPWANVESVAPGYRDDSMTGIASGGDTIALSAGVLSGGDPGIMLFDTSGNVVETSPGDYVFSNGSASSYFWLCAKPGNGYLFENNAANPNPKVHAITASAAGGITLNATWEANAGTGGNSSASNPIPPFIPSDRQSFRFFFPEWNGTTYGSILPPFTEIVSLETDGSLLGTDLLAWIPSPLFGQQQQPLACGPTVGDYIFTSNAYDTLYLIFDSLYKIIPPGDFNGVITDAKYFRQRNDGTHQIIVCGEFTEYLGEPAPYLVFIDQDGNRLSDLEWP